MINKAILKNYSKLILSLFLLLNISKTDACIDLGINILVNKVQFFSPLDLNISGATQFIFTIGKKELRFFGKEKALCTSTPNRKKRDAKRFVKNHKNGDKTIYEDGLIWKCELGKKHRIIDNGEVIGNVTILTSGQLQFKNNRTNTSFLLKLLHMKGPSSSIQTAHFILEKDGIKKGKLLYIIDELQPTEDSLQLNKKKKYQIDLGTSAEIEKISGCKKPTQTKTRADVTGSAILRKSLEK